MVSDVAPRTTDKISLFFNADVGADETLQWIVNAFANESGNDPAL